MNLKDIKGIENQIDMPTKLGANHEKTCVLPKNVLHVHPNFKDQAICSHTTVEFVFDLVPFFMLSSAETKIYPAYKC